MKQFIAVLLAALLFSTPALAKPVGNTKALGYPKPTYVLNTAHYTLFGKINEGTFHGFKVFLREAAKLQANVNVYISSPGGNAVAGLAIYEALKEYPGHVTCTVGPLAASAAFLILQACDYRIADARSALLTHRLSITTSGEDPNRLTPEEFLIDSIERMKAAQYAIALARELDTIIAQRLKLSIVEYLKRVDGKDWEMTAEEALKANAIDEIRPDGE